MQHWLRSGAIHAKLEISQPGDPEEQEADAMATRVMRSHAGVAAAACSCEDEDEPCDHCRDQQTVARKASGPAPAGTSAHRAINAILRSPGRGLDSSTRAFFEPRFGRDFSNVRIHTDASAAASAQSIRAYAYTVGDHVVFDAGKYAPDTEQGRTLLAHELAHVAHAADGIQRQFDDDDDDGIRAADPADPESWKQDPEETGFSGKPDNFDENLSAAPQAALDLENGLKANPSPGEADRDQVLAQIRALIRMNAVSLMASNRAHVEFTRDQFLKTPDNRDERETHSLYGGGAGANAPIETEDRIVSDEATRKEAEVVRAAAGTATFLTDKREKLEDSARAFDLEAGSQMRVGGDSFQEALEFMFHEAQEYESPDTSQYLSRILESLRGKHSLPTGQATDLIFTMGRTLRDWRSKQAGGVTYALDQLYNQFPFFAQLRPEDLPEKWEASSAEIIDSVRDAYDTLLSKIDEAIVKIGVGDIDPFDLPEALDLTRQSLSPDQLRILDGAIKDRQMHQFWVDMGLSIAQVLVCFIPVVGPALAVGLGAGQLIKGVDDALDRYEFSQASTNPEGTVLGASAPSRFEWAMLGVQAALTIADLGSMARELNLGRPHFTEGEPRFREESLPEEHVGETSSERESAGQPGDSSAAHPEPAGMPETSHVETREPLKGGGEARVSEDGHCEICHSPCKKEVEMARDIARRIEAAQLGTGYAGYARNLTKRIEALDEAIAASEARGTLDAEFNERFKDAFDILSEEIDQAHEWFIEGRGHFAPGEEIGSFKSAEPGSLFDSPEPRFNPERAYEGTAYHDVIKKEVLANLPKGTALSEDTVQEFLQTALKGKVKRMPPIPKKSTGIDLYIIDEGRRLVTPVDITGISGVERHVEKLAGDVEKIKRAFRLAGYQMGEPFEFEYVGKTFDEAADSAIAELRALASPK